MSISTHAPHTGRDHQQPVEPVQTVLISTHAPHTGRDSTRRRFSGPVLRFQPTRPIRGATQVVQHGVVLLSISTHAPHTGRDPTHQ